MGTAWYGKGFNPRVYSFSWGETYVSVPEADELPAVQDIGDAMAALLQLSDNELARDLAERWWDERSHGRCGRPIPDALVS